MLGDYISFRVFGMPIPKGSMRAYINPKTKRPVITHSTRGIGEWSQKVSAAAMEKRVGLWKRGTPIEIFMTFFLPKPKSYSSKILYPHKRPDVDKLVRLVLDACTGILWEDDSQVVTLIALKRFADEDEPPGVDVAVKDRGMEKNGQLSWS